MYRISILIFMFTTCFFLFGSGLFASENITISSKKVYIVEDVNFSLDITLDEIENLVGFQLKLSINEKFEFISLTAGDNLTSSKLKYNYDSNSNSLVIVYVDVNNSISFSNDSIFKIEFKSSQDLTEDTYKIISLNNDFRTEFVFMDEAYNLSYSNSANANFLDVEKAQIGDVNLDGNISSIDVAFIQLYVAKYIELDSTSLKVADVDNDGIVDIIDAAKIQLYVAELIKEFN